jgi:hypothetical protein
MHQHRFAKPVAGLGTLAAAAILALALAVPPVTAQGKGDNRGGGPPAASGGDKGGSGPSTSGAGRNGSSKSSTSREGKVGGRDKGDRSSNTGSFSQRGGGDDGRRHSQRRHSGRGGSDVTIYGYTDYGYTDDGCGWLHARAVRSGDSYWWRRYRACVRGY